MPTQTERVLKQFADQATACEHLGSPFTAKLCHVLASRLDAGTRFGHRILEWTGDPYADNVALRACGALHALVRTGWEPGLVEVYPPHEASEQKLWVAVVDVLSRHDHFLAERLNSAPQTNEVARSGILLGGMLRIAEAFRLPFEVYEIGASAGLNLGFDEYRYTLGDGRGWGNDSAPLVIDCPWRGNAPSLDIQLAVVGRHGCDLNPIDPSNPVDRERLLSYVWADQEHRLQRMAAALQLAVLERRRVDKADAADWVEQQFVAPPPPGVGRVLFHTIVWQYLSAATRTRIEAALEAAGAAATARTPLARLSMEADETPGKGARLDLTIWPGGHRVTLGRGDFHGRWAEWV